MPTFISNNVDAHISIDTLCFWMNFSQIPSKLFFLENSTFAIFTKDIPICKDIS